MVPAEVSNTLQDMAVDALYVAGAFLLSIVLVSTKKIRSKNVQSIIGVMSISADSIGVRFSLNPTAYLR